MKKKLSWHFWLACILIAIIAVVLFAQFSRKTEYAYEMADLQTMRSAEAVATLLWRDDLPEEPVEYWFDSGKIQLISVSDPMPEPYGVGTNRNGHAVKAFNIQTGKVFEYSENDDYTGKILHVVVSNKNNGLDIRMDWVQNR